MDLRANATRVHDMDLPDTYVEGFHNESATRKMKYCSMANKDVSLSILGIGGAALGNHYGNVEEGEGISIVSEALKNGVNYVDTSPYYGNTSSETLIGKALKNVPRNAYYLSTKVGRYGTSWEDFDHSAERIVKEFERSLERLGIDYVDFLLVHDIEFSPMQQILTEAIPAVQNLKEKKKVRYIGLSGYPLSVLWEAVEKSSVKIDIVLSYARSCLFDASMDVYASFFQAHNVDLINASLTGMGLLTNESPPDWHPASKEVKEMCQNASLFCKDQGIELGRLAIYHGMQKPWFISHLVGMKTLNELKNNIEITCKGLSDQELKALADVKEKNV